MPETGSVVKRHKQSEKRRLKNRKVKSRVRSCTRKFLESVENKTPDDAQSRFREVSSLLDRAVIKGVYHKNTAARKKHRLNKLLHNMS